MFFYHTLCIHPGAAGVGKTALVSQFMTSEYMNTYDASLGMVHLFDNYFFAGYSQLNYVCCIIYSTCVYNISLESTIFHH